MEKLVPSSIRIQLLLLILITLVPATLIIVLLDMQQRRHLVLDTEKEAVLVMQNLSAQQDQTCENARRLLTTLALVPEVRKGNGASCDTLFMSLLKADDQYVSLLLINPDGSIIAAGSSKKPFNFADRKYFQEAMGSKKFSVGEFAISRLGMRPTLHFAYPILDAHQRVISVLAVALNLDYFTKVFARARLPEKSALILSDWRGVILFAGPDSVRTGSQEDGNTMAAMKSQLGAVGLYCVRQQGVEYLNACHRFFLQETGELYMHARVSINMDATLADVRHSMLINLALILLVYLIALGMAWLFADRSIVRKIKLAVEAAQKIAGGTLDAGLNIPQSTGELGALFRSFEVMSSALRARDDDGRHIRAMLQEVGERYRMLFEHIPQPLIVIDAAVQRILTVNEAALIQYGYTKEEFLMLKYRDLIAAVHSRRPLPQSVPHCAPHLPPYTEPLAGIAKHVAKNGDVMDVEIYCSSIIFRGVASRMLSVSDITERLRSEKIQQALYKITKASSTAVNLQELYAMIHSILGEIVPAKNFSIALHDAVGDTISYPYFVDEYDSAPPTKKSGKGIAAYVLHTGEPLLATAETVQMLAAGGEVDSASFEGLEWLGAPLKIDDRNIGVVALRSYYDNVRFKEKDKVFLLFISSQIAKAIDRKEAEERIHRSLREKEVLLKEIHHRVKNNLQIISSLLNMQAGIATDPVTKDILNESRMRVRSMALIHEHLYQSDNFSEIDLNEYIRSIVVHLIHSYDKKNVACSISVAPLRLQLDAAIPCGLIVNELVSNALKYAFPFGADGSISVSVTVSGEQTVALDVSDDGIGMSPTVNIGTTSTLGLQLVQSLVHQLQGSIEITVCGGTRVHIYFPHKV